MHFCVLIWLILGNLRNNNLEFDTISPNNPMLQKAVSQVKIFQAIPELGKASWANCMAPVGHKLQIWLQDAEPAAILSPVFF